MSRVSDMNIREVKNASEVQAILWMHREEKYLQILKDEAFCKQYAEKLVKYGTFYVVSYQGNDCGFIGFYDNDEENKCIYISIGYIDQKMRWLRGVVLLQLAKVFNEGAVKKGIKKLRVEVDKENIDAIKMYQKFGLEIVEDASEYTVYMETQYEVVRQICERISR